MAPAKEIVHQMDERLAQAFVTGVHVDRKGYRREWKSAPASGRWYDSPRDGSRMVEVWCNDNRAFRHVNQATFTGEVYYPGRCTHVYKSGKLTASLPDTTPVAVITAILPSAHTGPIPLRG